MFNIKKFLINNGLTSISRKSILENTMKDLYKVVNQDYYGDEEQMFANPVDIMMYLGDKESRDIDEEEVYKFAEDQEAEIKTLFELQFVPQKYGTGFEDIPYGAMEYDGSIVIKQVQEQSGKPIKVKGYPYLGSTDRGPLGGTFILLDEKDLKIVKQAIEYHFGVIRGN